MKKALFRRFGAQPLSYRYSGELSKPFWNRVNAVREFDEARWRVLYAMGAQLQNDETVMLRCLHRELTDRK